MLGQDPSKKMNNRGGLPVKNIVTAIFILLSVYLLYIYNVAQNHLHDAEMTGSRYRREAEEKANEIQGLISAKDDFQERSETEKRELNNRLKSINQKHSMLQSQNTEVEADFMKLKQDMENLRAEHMQRETQHAQEYQLLKQTKEKEIADTSDELANVKKQNEDLQETISTLQTQIQNYEVQLQKALNSVESLETAKKSLLDQNAQLQMLQFQQQKQLELQKQNDENAQKAKLLQQQHQDIKVVSENNDNNNNMIFNANNDQDGKNVDLMAQDNKDVQQMIAAPGNNQGQAEKIDQLNALNQAKPPNSNFDGVPADDGVKNELDQKIEGEGAKQDVNPNDLQQGQILEPLKQDGGEADGEGRMNSVREEEEKREREEMDNQAAEHHDPLDLGQMQQPLDNNKVQGQGDEDKLGQQPAPVFVEQKQEDDDNNEADLEDDQRQYYQNREDGEEEEEDEEVADEEDDGGDDENVGVNDRFAEEEEEEEEDAVDVNNNDRVKAVDDQLNAWRHFNMAAQPDFGDNNHDVNNIHDEIDGGKYDDKEEEEEEEEEDNADDDYGQQEHNHVAVNPVAPL